MFKDRHMTKEAKGVRKREQREIIFNKQSYKKKTGVNIKTLNTTTSGLGRDK